MARTKKQFGIMDKDATKSKDFHFRTNLNQLVKIGRIGTKLGVSKTDVVRLSIDKMYEKMFPNE